MTFKLEETARDTTCPETGAKLPGTHGTEHKVHPYQTVFIHLYCIF